MIFNFIPIPPLDGSKVMFAFMDRRTEYQVRPFLEQYGLIILIILILPILPGGLDPRPDHQSDPRCVPQPPGGRSRARQFRAHLRARVAPAERAALATWTTPAQLALFDSMHVADRRHGLDVVASLRAEGVDRAGRPRRGPAPRRGQGRHGRLAAGRLLARRALRDLGLAGAPLSCPGSAAALERLRTHAETSAVLAAAAGCSARTVELIRHQDAPTIPSSASCCASPTRPTDDPGGSPSVPVMAVPTASATDGGPAVTFGEGRRPESRTQVQMAEFDGPLGLLLSLIEARQLDVLTVPLGALAGAYLDALGRLEADRLGNVSSFVAIASQLILIKSRAMLPRRTDPTDPMALADEGTDPEAELRARLLIYRAHRDAGLRLAELALARTGLFRREPATAHAAALAGAVPLDAPPLDPVRLVRALDRLAAIAPPPEPPPEALGRTITHRRAGRPHPGRPARRAHGRPPGPARGRARPGRHRGHVPGHARAHEAARDRRRAGRAVGPDRGPRHDARGTGRRRASTAVAADAPIDESLESFA